MDDLLDKSNLEKKISVTPKLIKMLRVIAGSEITLEEIKKINSGVIDIVSGLIFLQNFKENKVLIQVSIKTHEDGLYTLTSSNSNGFTNEIFDIFKNSNLINRPREIFIRNLDEFRENLSAAAQYKQSIDCIYDQQSKKLRFLQVSSTSNKKRLEEKIDKAHTSCKNSSSHNPLPIKVRFVGHFTKKQKAAFQFAADRWGQIIEGNLPKVKMHDEVIDGVVVYAVSLFLDGKDKILAQAAPLNLRDKSQLPLTGIMRFDIEDLSQIEANGNLVNLIIHEMGHVLGFGNLWEHKGLLKGVETQNPIFIGKNAMQEYAKLKGSDIPIPVPLENLGGAGTQYDHWRDSVFGNEVMSGFFGDRFNPISRVTIASLSDIGYSVNYDAADNFQIPNHLEINKMNRFNKKFNAQNCSRYLSLKNT